MKTISQPHRLNNQYRSGFALVATVSMMVLMTLIAVGMLSLTTIEQRSSGGGANEADRMARANARMALMIALGELQKAAGPDQRVTATASILGSATNPHATGTPAQDGKKHWLGVWDTSGYSPANPDNKTFLRWLVSGNQDQLDALGDARSLPAADDTAIFTGADAASTVKVPKVEVATAAAANASYYAYWVEDQGVKADLAWNEGSFTDADRQQAARLSSAPGPDHAVFEGPFASGVTYPLEKGSGYVDGLEKAFSPADMPLVMGDATDHATWLKANRHDMSMNVRGVIADVKKGGLRRDLSLAFEMDGSAESENAAIFNQQTGEFVGSGNATDPTPSGIATDPSQANFDELSSPYAMPGSSFYARHLFRDVLGAGNFFSDDITQPATAVRGPSWWLLRDYANLYKRLKTSGSTHAMAARAYFPNRTTPGTEDLVDMHCDQQGAMWTMGTNGKQYMNFKRTPVNLESLIVADSDNYYHRPIRANYAPVLLGVNAVYSLVYKNEKLQMVVDPFFIVWNPYNTIISAEKFAITIFNGFAGGVRFKITDAENNETLHGYLGGRYGHNGAETYFRDYAKNKTGVNAHLSYLISGLSMTPGEVMIFSPPNENGRSSDANVMNDELLPGMNYDATTSGIFFDEFPDDTPPPTRWWHPQIPWNTIPAIDPNTGARVPNIDPDRLGQCKVEICFNTLSQGAPSITNVIETSLPPLQTEKPTGNTHPTRPNDLTEEAYYGDNLAGKEFRLNWGGRSVNNNINTGAWGYANSFTFDELGSTKKSFGMLSMLTMPSDFDTAGVKMEVFSHLNATPIVVSQNEYFGRAPLNTVVKTVNGTGINNLNQLVGVDLDAFGDGDNGFYGKSYALLEGDTSFPLIDIPKAPLHSLVQLSGANISTRLYEPTHAIGNSWKPPYIPMDSIYYNPNNWHHTSSIYTVNDVSWQANNALFDRYFLSGIAPEFTIGSGGYTPTVANTSDAIEDTLQRFYGIDPTDTTQTVDPETAHASPALEPHVPSGKTPEDVVADLNPNDPQYDNDESTLDPDDYYDGYKKMGAYSLIKGAFNVNSTSVKAWAAFLKGNKNLALESAQGTTESGTGTPFPLGSTTSNTSTNNGWEKFSRLTDDQIWNDNDTPSDLTDDTGLAVEIVNQVKARGPFMSLSDFVNRRIGNDNRSHQGAIQEAIEQANINGNQSAGIRANTSESIPNYRNFYIFPYADDDNDPDNKNNYLGNRNNATGIPMEINQANILLPLAPRLSARSDTFRIRAYGEVRDSDDNIIAQATCEAIVQRLPEYVDSETDDPWDDDSQTPTLNTINQTYGRKFEIQSFRWLDQSEV